MANVKAICLRLLGCVHCARLGVSAWLCSFLLGCVMCLARCVPVGRAVFTMPSCSYTAVVTFINMMKTRPLIYFKSVASQCVSNGYTAVLRRLNIEMVLRTSYIYNGNAHDKTILMFVLKWDPGSLMLKLLQSVTYYVLKDRSYIFQFSLYSWFKKIICDSRTPMYYRPTGTAVHLTDWRQ